MSTANDDKPIPAPPASDAAAAAAPAPTAPAPPKSVGLNGGLPLVPESVLKKKHDLDEMKAHRAAQQMANPRGNKKVFSARSNSIKVKKPETYLAQAASRRNHSHRYGRVAKKGMQKRASNKPEHVTRVISRADDEGGMGDEGFGSRSGSSSSSTAGVVDGDDAVEVQYRSNSVGADVVFAVRIRDNVGLSSETRTALSRMRLRNLNDGVFLRYTESTRRALHLVEPWVTYGIISKSTATDLINRRGHGKVQGKRVPLTDNNVIESELGGDGDDDDNDGGTGMICVEDLVHEICTAGPGFRRASNFLWPFRLADRTSKFQRDKLNRKGGGIYGDCGAEMNDIVRMIL